MAVTALAFAAVAVAVARRAATRAAPAAERTTFAGLPLLAPTPPVPAAPTPRAPPTRRGGARGVVPTGLADPEGAQPVDDSTPSAAATGAGVGTTGTGGGATAGGNERAGAAGSPVFRGDSPFGRTRALTPAGRDRLAWDAGVRAAWLAPTRQPTAAETDSLARKESARVREWVEQDRPVPMPVGSIGVPLPGGGPTRAQRKRDSVLHAGNLARLRAIAERARSDSTWPVVTP